MSRKNDIADKLKSLGVDPVEGMARIALRAERDGNTVLAAKVYAELLQYCAPKLKAIEYSIAPDTQEFIAREARLNRIKELMHTLGPQLIEARVLAGLENGQAVIESTVTKHIPEE